MRVSPIIITGLILSSFLVSFIILTQPPGRCDPYSSPLTGIDIEGAHIVTEGAYFRFWIFNNNSFPINVTINGADTLSVPPQSWIDYDVIAPRTSLPYEQVTYKFSLTSYYFPVKTVDFAVLVLNSSFVQIFDLLVPVLTTIAAIAAALAAIVIVRRRRGRKNTPRAPNMSEGKMVACRVSIIVAAILCLLMSVGLFLSGLEAGLESLHGLNVKSLLLFEGMLGISCSVFNLTNEALVSRGRRRLLLSTIGACFLIFQGLHILDLGVMTNGWQVIIAFGIPVSVLSTLGLIFNVVFAGARPVGT